MRSFESMEPENESEQSDRAQAELEQMRAQLAHAQAQLSLVQTQLTQSLAECARLQQTVDNQRPIINSSYVRQLLIGTASEEDSDCAREYLGLNVPGLVYNVLYLCTYRNFDAEIIYSAIRNHIGELPCYFSARERTYSLLLSCPAAEGPELLMRLNGQVLHLHDDLLDTHNIWLYAGLGRNTDDPGHIWECYRQAVEAASYTYRNYILYPYEFLKKDANAFYYPPELSTKLVHLITAGRTEQVAEIFGTLHRENMENRSLPVPKLRYLLSEIRNTLVRARFALPESADTQAVAALDEQLGAQVTFQLCEDLAGELCRLFSAGTQKEQNQAATIEKYILRHFSDPTLGLVKISEKFGISKTYFSHMFKEKTGVNFSTYLENVRMSEATRLIREQKIGMNELYLAVGYTNPTTFRRAFKKIYGMTPIEFQRSSTII